MPSLPNKSEARYTVLVDTREKLKWHFPSNEYCAGTIDQKMDTGDYTLKGYETKFLIERKRNAAELAQNLFQKRFYKELQRMESFEQAYLFLEFTIDDVCKFPHNSGVPQNRWKRLKMTPQLFMKKIHELQINYPFVRVWFVGDRGRETASSLFKRIVEYYGKKQKA